MQVMDKFRKTSIRSRKKKVKPAIEGDLVEAGAIIFTKTQVDMQTIKRGDAFWRLLIRVVQWFRWSRAKGDPSTITHVDGWDGRLAFGSDLCDPDGGGLNRHVLPIVPHCFLKDEDEPHELIVGDGCIEVYNKKKHSLTIPISDLATCDFEVIQLPGYLREDFLAYQEKFRNDDIKYSLRNAAKTVITNAKFCDEARKIALADGIYALLGQPFRNRQGAVLQVCCSTFLARILMAIEHKQKIERYFFKDEFELKESWNRNLLHLKKGFKRLNQVHSQLIQLNQTFDLGWKEINKKGKRGELIELCLDYLEHKKFLIARVRRLSRDLAKRIYSIAEEVLNSNLYEKYFDSKEEPALFKINPERVTPAKLYHHLMEILENEP